MSLQEWSAEDERLMPLTRMWDADDFKKMFVRTDRETIPFDFADQTLCLLGLQFLWWDELSDIYYSVNLDPQESVRVVPKGCRRCERVGCSNIFEISKSRGGWNKKFCSTTCKVSENHYQKHGKGFRRRGPGHKLTRLSCVNGHDRTPKNTFIDKRTGATMCRDCSREADARYRARKKEELLAA